MKIWLILLVVALAGCTQQQVWSEHESTSRIEQCMSPAMKAVVMELVYMKSDPNIFKVKELDPFRRQ